MTEYRGTLPAGHALEEYRIERVLGQGGFGVTYLAHDTKLERQVAIKEYLPRQFAVREADSTVVPRSTDDEDMFRWGRERFLLEARTLAKLSHPGIVRVSRYFERHGTAYMVMDYELGRTLGEMLKAMDVPADETWVRSLLFPLLDALETVHGAHYLHRDVKPANIFVRSDGTPLLLDFGAARSVQKPDGGLTVVATAGYAPIEQYSREGHQGPWTDIYGLAAVFYRVIAGRQPLEAASRAQGTEMTPLTEIGKGRFDPRLLAALDWGLRPGERARPQSIAEWRQGRGEEVGLDQSADPSEPSTLPRRDARPAKATPGRRRWPLIAGAAAAAVVLVIAAALLVLRRDDVQPVGPGGGDPDLVAAQVAPNVGGGASESETPLADRLDEPPSGEQIASIPGDRPDPRPPDGGGEPPPPPAVSDSTISALGIVDAADARYEGQPDLLLADLRADARRQAIEKAVGIFVARDALLDRYESLEDEIFERGELVERLVDNARPDYGKDGLVYLTAAADVRLRDLRKVVYTLSREQRIMLIRAQGDPVISVSVSIRDAERGSPIERSALAENVIKARIREFGFRVASPRDPSGGDTAPEIDFAVKSEAKLKRLSHRLAASGITIEKYVLTSWTVSCTEQTTGEDIYFDNRLPKSGSWADEDLALQEIGTLIADSFSRDLFAEHLPRASRRSRLAVHALPSLQAASLLRRELLGLRSVVQVGMETDPGGTTARFALTWYDQGPGGEQSFDGTVLAPLRHKLGPDCLTVERQSTARDVVVRLAGACAPTLVRTLESLPAAGLGVAPAERLAAVARSVPTMRKLAELNPDAVSTLAARGLPLARDALGGRVDL